MTQAQLLAAVQSELDSHVDPAFKEGVNRFFKEEVIALGVRSNDLGRIVQLVAREIKAWDVSERFGFCEDLWQAGHLEGGVIVCHSLRRFGRTFHHAEFETFERWVDHYIHNWAHCDGLSGWLIASCIANAPELKKDLKPWRKSRNVWKRRASAVSLLQEGKRGNSLGDIVDTAMSLRTDKHAMVQKGVGWLLKETYPKHPDAVVALLQEADFPRLVVRYAAEKMSAPDKAKFGLGLKRRARE